MAEISIALSKGRIFDETAPLLERVGIPPKANGENSRKLVMKTGRRDVRLIIVRATDTPTYVQHGGADLGIAGRDVLVEWRRRASTGRWISASPRPHDGALKRASTMKLPPPGRPLRVATKYVNTTREHFAAKE